MMLHWWYFNLWLRLKKINLKAQLIETENTSNVKYLILQGEQEYKHCYHLRWRKTYGPFCKPKAVRRFEHGGPKERNPEIGLNSALIAIYFGDGRSGYDGVLRSRLRRGTPRTITCKRECSTWHGTGSPCVGKDFHLCPPLPKDSVGLEVQRGHVAIGCISAAFASASQRSVVESEAWLLPLTITHTRHSTHFSSVCASSEPGWDQVSLSSILIKRQHAFGICTVSFHSRSGERDVVEVILSLGRCFKGIDRGRLTCPNRRRLDDTSVKIDKWIKSNPFPPCVSMHEKQVYTGRKFRTSLHFRQYFSGS